jgi:tight adherence protein B
MNPLALLAGLLGLVLVAALGFAFTGGSGGGRMAKRAQAISERSRTKASRVRPAAAAADPATRRKQIVKSLREQERIQRKASFNLAARLQQAGLTISPQVFWAISAGLGVVVLLATLVASHKPILAIPFGMVAALGLPRWVVGFLAKRRAKKFVEGFADASDIIVRGIKSGLPVHECLQIIGKEAHEPLASEFRRLVDGVQHGLTMDQALEKMHERMPIPELRFFTIVLGIQQKTGGNLAEALGNLSQVLRARKLMREKIKAMSSEATASAMIIGALPPGVMIMISITTPTYLQILFVEPKGQLLLAAAVGLMGFGVFVMNRMINFKI